MLDIIFVILLIILWIYSGKFWEGALGSLVILVLGLAIWDVLVAFIHSDVGKMFLIISCIVICLCIYLTYQSKINAAKNEKEQQELISKVKHFTKSNRINNYQKVKEKGWIRTEGQNTREEVENILKLKAAKRDCNAVMEFSWHTEKVSYVAGKGPKGNPYYNNRTVFSGEAIAVTLKKIPKKIPQKTTKKQIEPKTKTKKQAENKPVFKKYEAKSLILDGNNIVGRAEWKFDAIASLLGKLKDAGYDFTVFFDNNIYRALKENELISDTETIKESISKAINQDEKNIVVTPAGVQADSFILELADQQNSAVISNDKFTDFEAHYPEILNDRLLKFEVINDTVLIPKLTF
tara:strand:- start:30 stop:1079 length:1050 start_codon:yes stop_codon:yes gene_type:complete